MVPLRGYDIAMELLILSNAVFLFITSSQSAEVTVKAPVNPVQVGGILSIHCEIRDLGTKEKVIISRFSGDNEEAISADKTFFDSDTDNTNMFVAERTLADGATVFFLSIIEVTKQDQGEYFCKVKSSNLESTLAVNSIVVEINYFPEDTSPSCWPQELPNVIEGIPLTFNCSSEKGNPVVDITWSREGKALTTDPVLTTSDRSLVYSVFTFTPTLKDKGAIFLCTINSLAFSDVEKQCHIGPLTVHRNPNLPERPVNIPEDIITPTSKGIDKFDGGSGVISQDTKQATRPSAKCRNACSSFSAPVFYWVLGTIVAGFIAIVFLIIGIILYIRYSKIVARGKERHFAICRQTSGEDAYEKLEYRKGDRTLYMALDKHGLKTETPAITYGQTEAIHYNMTPTHLRPQPQFS